MSKDKIPVSKGYFASIVMALINSIPALVTFVIVREVSDNLMIAMVSSIIVFIIAIGFSIKIARKILR